MQHFPPDVIRTEREPRGIARDTVVRARRIVDETPAGRAAQLRAQHVRLRPKHATIDVRVRSHDNRASQYLSVMLARALKRLSGERPRRERALSRRTSTRGNSQRVHEGSRRARLDPVAQMKDPDRVARLPKRRVAEQTRKARRYRLATVIRRLVARRLDRATKHSHQLLVRLVPYDQRPVLLAVRGTHVVLGGAS